MSRIQLITFDLDGTMVDTAREIAEAANRTLHDHGLPRRPASEVALHIGHGTRELMRALLADAGRQGHDGVVQALAPDEVMVCFERHYHDTTGTDSQLYPGCLEGLLRLQEAGVQLACVTNKEARFAHRVLEVTGLSSLFKLVIGGDTLPHKKPHPLVIDHCLQATGVDQSRAAHVGDSSIDVDTARRAGVAAWAVPYGYNGGRSIALSEPDRLFDRIDLIADHVLSPLAA